MRATSTNTCRIISKVSAVIGSPPWLVVLPGGPVAAGLVVGHSAAMKALLTPLMFIVKTPCSIAE
jgi:hypothetical protein